MSSDPLVPAESAPELPAGDQLAGAVTTQPEPPKPRYAYVRARLATAYELIASGMTPRQAALELIRTCGLRRRTAARYIALAIAQMMTDSLQEPLPSKRARIVEMLHAQVKRALELKHTYTNRRGDVITVGAPDLRAANQALALLAQIEGVTRASDNPNPADRTR